jgi:polysaccharide export outer membrane protein
MAWLRRNGLMGTLVVAAGLVAACSGSPSPQIPAAPTGNAGAVVTPSDAAAADAVAGYVLGPGERVRLTVFRHEDLSGEFEVDGGGTFAMPLIGEINAAGLTARQLEERIATRLKDGYLVDPQISIEVLNYRPFFILGEVNAPGSYPYVSGMSVINAVAVAGGFTYRAKEDGIEIQRGGSGAPSVVVTVDTAILPGDIVRVPERFF